ncbi:hypothetical protein J6X13_01840 [Candidatus Saccharibacteria bacterium]|nr:hypothetical protein [Candidatus Saccharibacteria bacterium]
MNLPNHIDNPGSENYSIADAFGECVREELYQNKDFYFFSPDETTSNKMEEVFDASDRAWALEMKPWDLSLGANGHVIEMLSENTLFAVMAGHILSGGAGCMTSYESFFPIVSSQVDQHLKFLSQSKQVEWREDVNALNLLSTSCWQRQDHNGFTHQNPALISNLLAKPSNLANCFFPVDDISAHAVWDYMKTSKNVINLATFNKIDLPRWIDIDHARFQLEQGCSIFQFASDENPDIIVAAAGDIPTREAIAAIEIAKKDVPELKVRFVGVTALSYGAIGTTTSKLKPRDFDDYFTIDKPIVFNFHGYTETMRSILSHYTDMKRVSIHGYSDQGSTTSPLDELARNECSRYDIAADILERTGHYEYAEKYRDILAENAFYASLTSLDRA